MTAITRLTAQEQRELAHYIANRKIHDDNDHQVVLEDLIVADQVFEEKMAKVSEEENFNLKNRYRHQWTTMQWANKKRMPIHETKVADLLRNQHVYRSKVYKEIGNYQSVLDNTQLSNGVLTYVNEAANGELRDLLNDVGIKDETLSFTNLAKLNKMRE